MMFNPKYIGLFFRIKYAASIETLNKCSEEVKALPAKEFDTAITFVDMINDKKSKIAGVK